MSWQLWILVAAAAAGLLVLLVLRFRRAQQVFDEIVDELDQPPTSATTDQPTPGDADQPATGDELEHRRRRRRPAYAATHHPRLRRHR